MNKEQLNSISSTNITDELYDAWKRVNYLELRKRAYPSIEKQLDMQCHDSLDGTITFKDTIDAVKMQYPKPTEGDIEAVKGIVYKVTPVKLALFPHDQGYE